MHTAMVKEHSCMQALSIAALLLYFISTSAESVHHVDGSPMYVEYLVICWTIHLTASASFV